MVRTVVDARTLVVVRTIVDVCTVGDVRTVVATDQITLTHQLSPIVIGLKEWHQSGIICHIDLLRMHQNRPA